ncbi:MAG: prepilin-type N-terminal cleavage/methylation domain-containing protein [Gammaproteobacteria bacterium]|nr:prepilin-type N-terminal cleavage/methylation domain-containing protein [Gammaproteobacteria bacterium]
MPRGYTLIELILVLILTAILAADVAARDPAAPLDAAAVARQVAAAVRLAQLDSMTKGARYCVQFSATGYAFATQDCTQLVADPVTGQTTVDLPNGMTLAWSGLSTNNVSFSGNGVPYGGAAAGTQGQALAASAAVSVTDGPAVYSFLITPQTGVVQP